MAEREPGSKAGGANKSKMIKHHIQREAPNTSDRPAPAAIGDARITANQILYLFSTRLKHFSGGKNFRRAKTLHSSTRNQISREQDKIRTSKPHLRARCFSFSFGNRRPALSHHPVSGDGLRSNDEWLKNMN